jgi:hypothetical protein
MRLLVRRIAVTDSQENGLTLGETRQTSVMLVLHMSANGKPDDKIVSVAT